MAKTEKKPIGAPHGSKNAVGNRGNKNAAGRPPAAEPSRQFSSRLPISALELLAALAAKKGISQAKVLDLAIRTLAALEADPTSLGSKMTPENDASIADMRIGG